MSEYKQKHSNLVTLAEYEAAKVWRADATELSTPQTDDYDEQNQRLGKFTMRLLQSNKQAAQDQLVTVVATDNISPDSALGALAITVRATLPADQKAKLATYHVSNDGIILNNNSNTPNFEKGYFVGGEGIGEDELQDFAMQLLVPVQLPELKAVQQ